MCTLSTAEVSAVCLSATYFFHVGLVCVWPRRISNMDDGSVDTHYIINDCRLCVDIWHVETVKCLNQSDKNDGKQSKQ